MLRMKVDTTWQSFDLECRTKIPYDGYHVYDVLCMFLQITEFFHT